MQKLQRKITGKEGEDFLPPPPLILNRVNGEKIFGKFYEKKLQKINQTKFRFEEVIKKKGCKLYVKWKGLLIARYINIIK